MDGCGSVVRNPLRWTEPDVNGATRRRVVKARCRQTRAAASTISGERRGYGHRDAVQRSGSRVNQSECLIRTVAVDRTASEVQRGWIHAGVRSRSETSSRQSYGRAGNGSAGSDSDRAAHRTGCGGAEPYKDSAGAGSHGQGRGAGTAISGKWRCDSDIDTREASGAIIG